MFSSSLCSCLPYLQTRLSTALFCGPKRVFCVRKLAPHRFGTHSQRGYPGLPITRTASADKNATSNILRENVEEWLPWTNVNERQGQGGHEI